MATKFGIKLHLTDFYKNSLGYRPGVKLYSAHVSQALYGLLMQNIVQMCQRFLNAFNSK